MKRPLQHSGRVPHIYIVHRKENEMYRSKIIGNG